jgi:hypothetical protein
MSTYVIIGIFLIIIVHFVVVLINDIVTRRLSLISIGWLFLIVMAIVLYKVNPLGL